MRRVFFFLQLLFSAARRALSPSRAILPLIRIIVALKRFVRGCFKSLESPRTGVSTSSRPPESRSTTPQQLIQSAQAPDRFVPSFLPTGLNGQQQDTLLQHSVVPDATLRTLPIPFAPGWVERYEHRRPVEKKPNKEKIKAGQMSFVEEVPGHWERVVHPEGARYYFDANRNVFTDISLAELGNLDELDACIRFLRARESQVLSSSTFRRYPTQLVIQLMDSECWVYYFVNHDTHAVFWVEEFDLARLMPQNMLGVTENSHIMYAIEEQYWWHCEQYPNSVPLLQVHVTEMWGTMAYAYIDSITSVAPLCPFSQDELVKILGLMPYLQGRVCATDGHAVWILARAMRVIARAKFYHFYGQPGARLEGDMSVYIQQGDHKDESCTFHFLDFLLCFALVSHVQELKSIWVDDIINYARWSRFASNLTARWNGFTIYSTVMLAVDVSLLAVPAVNKGDVNSQSVAIVATYISLLCVIGSLVSSVLLTRQINTMDTSAEAAEFMKKMTHWKGGAIILGIIFSLPYALLIWAMFFFTLALTYVIFKTTDPASLSIMILGTIMITSVISLPIWWGRDYGSFDRWFSVLKGRSPSQEDSTGQQQQV